MKFLFYKIKICLDYIMELLKDETLIELYNASSLYDYLYILLTSESLGNLKEDKVKDILSAINMKEFTAAWTHRSANTSRNYEVYEYLGDPICNEFLARYLHVRFPKIISSKWKTRLYNNLKSGATYASRAIDLGMDKFIIYGNEMETFLRKTKTKGENQAYIEMVGDVFEAFAGCLSDVLTKLGYEYAVAIGILHRIFKYTFDRMPISLNPLDITDPVTRLKELYESKIVGEEKWPRDNKQIYKITKILEPGPNKNKTETIVYGWPNGPQKEKVELGHSLSYDGDEGKKIAAAMALDTLAKKYNIKEAPGSGNIYEPDTSTYKGPKKKRAQFMD